MSKSWGHCVVEIIGESGTTAKLVHLS